MNEKENKLIINIYNDKKFLDIYSDEKIITLEEIKKKCKEKFQELENKNEDLKNINLWYIDDENDKILINNDIDLITYIYTNAKEIESTQYLIILK